MQNRSQLKASAGSAIRALFPPFALFALNLWICGRLLHIEYLQWMGSIEGSFIALATYIEHHWPLYDWFPVWYSGMPFGRIYPPGLHYTVAVTAKLLGMNPASAYHAVVAITYSLGGAALYCLARTIGADRATAFISGLGWSIFSPSLLLSAAIRHDAGGLLSARRLQALVVYGEGPNVTGLMLAMFALALLSQAVRRRRPAWYLLAALVMAAVPVVNWTATIALLLGLIAWLAATEWRDMRRNLSGLVLIGAATAIFAFPFSLPSTIRTTVLAANVMDDGPTPGAVRWILLSAMTAGLVLLRMVSMRARIPFGPRFAMLYFLLTGWIFLVSEAGIRLIPYPQRFHLAMEIAMILLAAFAATALWRQWPVLRVPGLVLLVVLSSFQAVHYRRYARNIIGKTTDVTRTIEYEEAQWLDRNMNGARVMIPGSISFWANVFTETPQMTGCCLQSLLTRQPQIFSYLIGAGYMDDAGSSEYSLLWLKAFGVRAIAMAGSASREHYKDYRFPHRFDGRLPLAWSSGDDFIYSVPARAPGLARVVPASAAVRKAPEHGADVTELRPFVRALDDPSLPLADFNWVDVNTARIRGTLTADQALSVAVAWDPGWSAMANGRAVAARPDGLGLIEVDPQCAGVCEVRLHWSAGAEPRIVISAALLTLIGMIVWIAVDAKGGASASKLT